MFIFMCLRSVRVQNKTMLAIVSLVYIHVIRAKHEFWTLCWKMFVFMLPRGARDVEECYDAAPQNVYIHIPARSAGSLSVLCAIMTRRLYSCFRVERGRRADMGLCCILVVYIHAPAWNAGVGTQYPSTAEAFTFMPPREARGCCPLYC